MDIKLIILSVIFAALLIVTSFFAARTAEKKSHAAKLAERNEQASKDGQPVQGDANQSWMNEILSR